MRISVLKGCLALACIAVLLCSAGCGTPRDATQTTGRTLTCTVSVCCTSLLDNDALDETKRPFVPSDGYILHPTAVSCSAGESVYDVLRRVCAENVCTDNCRYCQDGGIQMESVLTPGYGTYYVEGIHHLYEKDCGAQSGWIYRYNGESPPRGCSEVQVQDGDVIEWIYSVQYSGS